MRELFRIIHIINRCRKKYSMPNKKHENNKLSYQMNFYASALTKSKLIKNIATFRVTNVIQVMINFSKIILSIINV